MQNKTTTERARPFPDPWEFHIGRYPSGKLHGEPYIYAPQGPDTHRHVATVCFDPGAPQNVQDAQESNGFLLAAAPQLLAALHAALFFVPLGTVARDSANAAIAKAEKGEA